MATTTETLTSNFSDQLSLDSSIKSRSPYINQFNSPAPSRPTSSHPRRSRPIYDEEEDHHSHPQDHYNGNQDLPSSPDKARPKTSHVSGRRRWIPETHDEEDSKQKYQDQDFVPDSPSLRPMTSIYRFVFTPDVMKQPIFRFLKQFFFRQKKGNNSSLFHFGSCNWLKSMTILSMTPLTGTAPTLIVIIIMII